jgi:predicted transcriptional regulator
MPRRREAPPLHDLERDVMDVVWRRGAPATVRDVLDAVNARHRRQPRAYTTIMTTIHRLERKGMLRRDKREKSHTFRPALTEAEYAVSRADALVAELGDAALAAFARRVGELDARRLADLRRLGDER